MICYIIIIANVSSVLFRQISHWWGWTGSSVWQEEKAEEDLSDNRSDNNCYMESVTG